MPPSRSRSVAPRLTLCGRAWKLTLACTQDDIFQWHFTLRGAEDSDYQGTRSFAEGPVATLGTLLDRGQKES